MGSEFGAVAVLEGRRERWSNGGDESCVEFGEIGKRLAHDRLLEEQLVVVRDRLVLRGDVSEGLQLAIVVLTWHPEHTLPPQPSSASSCSQEDRRDSPKVLALNPLPELCLGRCKLGADDGSSIPRHFTFCQLPLRTRLEDGEEVSMGHVVVRLVTMDVDADELAGESEGHSDESCRLSRPSRRQESEAVACVGSAIVRKMDSSGRTMSAQAYDAHLDILSLGSNTPLELCLLPPVPVVHVCHPVELADPRLA